MWSKLSLVSFFHLKLAAKYSQDDPHVIGTALAQHTEHSLVEIFLKVCIKGFVPVSCTGVRRRCHLSSCVSLLSEIENGLMICITYNKFRESQITFNINKHYCVEGLRASALRKVLDCIKPIWFLSASKNHQILL